MTAFGESFPRLHGPPTPHPTPKTQPTKTNKQKPPPRDAVPHLTAGARAAHLIPRYPEKPETFAWAIADQ